jgi:NitT/TauT family transport system permease protein
LEDYPQFLPSPLQVWEATVDLWQQGYLLSDAAISCFRVGSGFLLVAIIAVPIGIGIGAFVSIRALLEPLIGIIR